MECKELLIKLVEKGNGKIITEVSLVRSMSSLDPREMETATKETNLKKFKAVLTTMNEADRVTDNDVDELLQRYRDHYFSRHIFLLLLESRTSTESTNTNMQTTPNCLFHYPHPTISRPR